MQRRFHETAARPQRRRGRIGWFSSFAGWVERSETHHFASIASSDEFRWCSTHPTNNNYAGAARHLFT